MQKFIQLKEYLLELSFLALLIRIIVVGAGIGEALALISLVLSMGYTKWLTKSKIEQYEELKSLVSSESEKNEKKFEQIFAKFNSQNMEKQLRKGASSEELQSGLRKRSF